MSENTTRPTPAPAHTVEVPSSDVAEAFQLDINRAIHDAWQEGYDQSRKDDAAADIARVHITPETVNRAALGFCGAPDSPAEACEACRDDALAALRALRSQP